MNIEFSLYEKDGEIIFRNKKQLIAELLKTGWHEMEGTIRKKRRTRSVQINRYYWGVVIALVRDAFKDLGNEVESQEVHEYLKGKYHYKEMVNEETGEVILDEETGLPVRIPLSTANISNTDFIVYMERIKKFASEFLNIYIPEPNEQLSAF